MKTLKHFMLVLGTTGVVLSCTNDRSAIDPAFKLKAATSLSDDDYNIYSLILSGDTIVEGKNIVVLQPTFTYYTISDSNAYYQSFKGALSDIDTSTLVSFFQNNDYSYNLGNKIAVPGKAITLISDQEWQFIFNTEDQNKSWPYFNKKYPNASGYVNFTRIGYNTCKNQALVGINHSHETFSFYGFTVFLVKKNNEWKIIKVMASLIS